MRANRSPSGSPAIAEMLTEGERFHDTPLGGYAGEALPAAPEPAPAPPTQLVIEPPPWHDELQAGAPAPDPPKDELSAVDRIRDFDPPPPAGPPEVLAPLIRPRPPAPDWRAEERERAGREGGAPLTEPRESLQARPAPKSKREP